MGYIIKKETIESLLDGYWYQEPKNEEWYVDNVVIHHSASVKQNNLLIAINQETWVKGTQNTGVYAQWEDTHLTAHLYPHLFRGVIANRPIEKLSKDVAQFIVTNTFDFIDKFPQHIRPKLNSKVIAITGTVGKTSTKEYLNVLLKRFGQVHATHSNHNTRTGVKLTVCNAMQNPDYLIVETALSALFMKFGSMSRLVKPHIAVITEIGVGQKGYDELKTAEFKSRIGDGLDKNGIFIINRDIKVFDELKTYCNRYSNQVITYGYHPQSDIQIIEDTKNLILKIDRENYQFIIPPIDRGTKNNLTAVLTVAYVLQLDLSALTTVFEDVKHKKSVLEIIHTQKKPVTIIDDTYNAEHLSMLNAFEYCETHFPSKRKVLIIGDIINLEDKSIQVHESLAAPIEKHGFELIATFGKYTQYLNHKLPKSKLIGHFNNAQDCAAEVLKYVNDQDVILIKGSRRNSTIQNIPKLLVTQLEKEVQDHFLDNFSYRLNFDDVNNPLLLKNTAFGMGSLILIYLALKKISTKEIDLGKIYTVTESVACSARNMSELGLKKDEVYTFYELLQCVIHTQKADATLALAEHVFENLDQALLEIHKQAKVWGIDPSKILDITGHDCQEKKQSKTLQDLLIIIKHLKRLPRSTLDLMKIPYLVFKGKFIKTRELFRRNLNNDYTLVVGFDREKIYLTFNKDYLGFFNYSVPSLIKEYEIPYIMTYGHESLPIAKTIEAKSPYINILADCYFGEFYTRVRQKKGINDALQKFGYQHSFEKLANFFKPEDINMVNLEASFTQKKHSDLKLIKPYILDAVAKPTLDELQSRNIQYLNLANNHAKDFGEEGFQYTIEQIEKYGFDYIGAGLNQKKANQYFEIKYAEKQYAIFNGYWHRDRAYQEFEFYALGEQSGVSCLTGLFNLIKQYKKQNPAAYVIVIAHWGVDFAPIDPAQRRIATSLIDGGVDLIIGHGAHTLQPIRKYKNKAIIYSLGNGVFNSNGEFERYQALPYGLVSCLNLSNHTLKLYPFMANNKETFWQPRVVNESQFNEVFEYFVQQDNSYPVKKAQDAQGYYIEMDILK